MNQQVRDLLVQYHPDGVLPLQVVARCSRGHLKVEQRLDELLELSRVWPGSSHDNTSAEHLLKAEKWLRRIYPTASLAMLLAR